MSPFEDSPGPSPAWLGVFAAASFAALVATSFASGYHLVGARRVRTPPPAAASSGMTQPEAGSTAPPAGAERPARIRRHERYDTALVRAEPPDGDLVDRLPPDHSVLAVERRGDWYRVQYELEGKSREGWTHEVNLEFAGEVSGAE